MTKDKTNIFRYFIIFSIGLIIGMLIFACVGRGLADNICKKEFGPEYKVSLWNANLLKCEKNKDYFVKCNKDDTLTILNDTTENGTCINE